MMMMTRTTRVLKLPHQMLSCDAFHIAAWWPLQWHHLQSS